MKRWLIQRSRDNINYVRPGLSMLTLNAAAALQCDKEIVKWLKRLGRSIPTKNLNFVFSYSHSLQCFACFVTRSTRYLEISSSFRIAMQCKVTDDRAGASMSYTATHSTSDSRQCNHNASARVNYTSLVFCFVFGVSWNSVEVPCYMGHVEVIKM